MRARGRDALLRVGVARRKPSPSPDLIPAFVRFVQIWLNAGRAGAILPPARHQPLATSHFPYLHLRLHIPRSQLVEAIKETYPERACPFGS